MDWINIGMTFKKPSGMPAAAISTIKSIEHTEREDKSRISFKVKIDGLDKTAALHALPRGNGLFSKDTYRCIPRNFPQLIATTRSQPMK